MDDWVITYNPENKKFYKGYLHPWQNANNDNIIENDPNIQILTNIMDLVKEKYQLTKAINLVPVTHDLDYSILINQQVETIVFKLRGDDCIKYELNVDDYITMKNSSIASHIANHISTQMSMWILNKISNIQQHDVFTTNMNKQINVFWKNVGNPDTVIMNGFTHMSIYNKFSNRFNLILDENIPIGTVYLWEKENMTVGNSYFTLSFTNMGIM